MTKELVCISGGFDGIHCGHIRYIQEAAKLGQLCCILNTDDFLQHKKGYVFMRYEERKEILEAFQEIEIIEKCIDKDSTVCKTLAMIEPSIFCNGGDRDKANIPEVSVCKAYGIKMVFGVGGENKPQSSSWLIDGLMKQILTNPNLRKRYGIKP